MLEQLIERVLPTTIAVLELMGIFIVATPAPSAFGRYLEDLFTRTPCDVKSALANGLVLSLELRMATEVLKTTLARNLEELLVLGVVTLLRALLFFLTYPRVKGTHPPK